MKIKVITLETCDIKVIIEHVECDFVNNKGNISKTTYSRVETLFSDKNTDTYSNKLPSSFYNNGAILETKHEYSRSTGGWNFVKFTQVGQYSIYKMSYDNNVFYNHLIIVIDSQGYVIYSEIDEGNEYVIEFSLINDHLIELAQIGTHQWKDYKHLSYVSDKLGLVLHYKLMKQDGLNPIQLQVSLPNSTLFYIDNLWIEYDMQMELIQKHYDWFGFFCNCAIYGDYYAFNLYNEKEERGILFIGNLILYSFNKCIRLFGKIEGSEFHFLLTDGGFLDEYDVHILKESRCLFTLHKVRIFKAWFEELSETFRTHILWNGPYVAFVTNAVTQEKYFGLVDEKLNVVLEFTMDSVKLCKNGRAIVESSGEFGVVDKSGQIILNPIYSSCEEVDDFFICTFDNGSFLYDYQGTEIMNADGRIRIVHEPFYDEYKCAIRYMIHNNLKQREGLEIICVEGDYVARGNYNEVKKTDGLRFGLIDSQGNLIIEPIYTYLAFVDVPEEAQKNSFKILGLCYSTSGNSTVEGEGYLKSHEGLVGFMDLLGNVVIPDIYDSFVAFGGYIRTRQQSRYGLYDIYGKQYLEDIYTFISLLAIGRRTNMACYMIGGEFDPQYEPSVLYQSIDRLYNINIEFNPPHDVRDLYYSSIYRLYEYALSIGLENYIFVGGKSTRVTGAKYGFYNLMTGVKSLFQYDEVHCFRGKYAVVKRDGWFFVIDWSLQELNKYASVPSRYVRIQNKRSIEHTSTEDTDDWNSYIEDGIKEAYNSDSEGHWNTD